MGIINKTIENGKKLAKAGIRMMPKGQTGNVVKEQEESLEFLQKKIN